MVLIPLVERLGRRVLRSRGFATQLVDSRAGKIHVYDCPGRGRRLPAVVVLHGLGLASTAFTPLLVRLQAEAKRVVALDYPGHGFSAPPREKLTPSVLYDAVMSVLDDRVPEPAVVIGNSLGGGVALQRAVRRPGQVASLVLLSPAGSRSTDAEWRRIRDAFHVTNRREARVFLDRVYHRTPVIARLLAHEMPSSLKRRSVRDLLHTATNEDAPTPEQLRGLEMPILLFWGRSERLFSDEQLAYFRGNLPKHTVIEQPHGFGHCPHFDDPARLVSRIVSFASSTSAE